MTTTSNPIGDIDLSDHAARLQDYFRQFDCVLVAYSGGVDSALVAAAAQRTLGDAALAVTARSPSVSAHQLEIAIKTAAELGIRHRIVDTDEIDRTEYRANDGRRCFFCKETLYQTLRRVAADESIGTIVSGTNADDLGDYRPGIDAGRQAEVRTPLADLGIGKTLVRGLAKAWGVAVWDLPAAPCLASRIAYGVEVTPERLAKIESAEAWLRSRGFEELRVRYHQDDLARIEVPVQRLAELAQPAMAVALTKAFSELGFRYVTLDVAGLRSGNLNDLIQLRIP
jgi:uncharacterized protein